MNRIKTSLFAFLLFSKMLAGQVDTVPPVLFCKNSVDIGVPFPCFITVWANDFIDSAADNSQSAIDFGIRKSCTGIGFPEKTNVLVQSSEWGIANVEVWARDAAGNTSSCTVLVYVTDAAFSCDPISSVEAKTPANQGIKDVTVEVKGSNCLGDSMDYGFMPIVTMQNGYWMTYGGLVQIGFTTHITPSKNINPLNGVTTNDLVLISKHILGLQPFDSPWKYIAADANQDGKVTTYDVIVLRKLILGITTELPNGKSWRFAPHDYVFPDPSNPFQPAFPERIEVPNTADPVPSSFHFKGVKIGDVDFSADPGQ